MRIRFSDLLLLLVILSLPSLALIQSCNSGGPIAPGSKGDQPPDDNHAPVPMITTVSPDEGPTPFIAILDSVGTYDPDGDPMVFTWTFSDGTSETGPYVEHQFIGSGRHEARLVVTDKWGEAGIAGPEVFYSWGLANSAWPKFAHDERNSGLSPNTGPMINHANSDSGGAFPRYWRSDNQDDIIRAICVSYDGRVYYAQGQWLRARTSDGIILWDLRFDSDINAWPAIAYDGSIVLATEPGIVSRISDDGTLLWSIDVNDGLGLQYFCDSAVNIDGNRHIYVCGADHTGLAPAEEKGCLFALSFDGDLLWHRPFPVGYWNRGRLVTPVITPDGKIVVNGNNALFFSPDGTELARTPFISKGTQQYLGPPAVTEDGHVAFTHGRLPVFDSNGNFVLEIMGNLLSTNDNGQWYAGYKQAPLIGQISISQIQVDSSDTANPYFTVGTLGGVLLKMPIPREYPFEDIDYIWGGAQDSLGTAYISCRGLHAYSDITMSSIWPYAPARYSMWSYIRPTGHMTPPVIGEDNWLYLGYGNDIMALGD